MKRASGEAEKILAQSSAWGFDLFPSQAASLVDFASILATYDEANVIGAKTVGEIVNDHVLDSLSCLLFEPLRDAKLLADVGSGGGLPGVPLGIAINGLRVSLVEATTKKARFLESAVRQLGHTGFHVLNQRVEEVGGSEEFRGLYDVATARALSSLDVLAEYCLPLVKVGGHVVAMKGRVEKDELRRGEYAAKLLGAEIADMVPVSRLPEYEEKQRCLVVFEKTRGTPEKYPRRVGLPSKKPLGRTGNP